MKYLTILGSTGSIGQATISVVHEYSDQFTILALVANNNVTTMIKQCFMLSPKYVCMVCKNAAKKLKDDLITAGKYDIEVLSGIQGACILAALQDVDIVMSAIVGIAGLRPTFAALRSGKKILLANKETLVVSGQFFMKESNKYHASVLPIDSEHNAIFQSLPTVCQKQLGQFLLSEYGISYIVLTASGGAFLHTPQEQLSTITPGQASIHPNWSMGRKISVDSATMMNKGLEYIEARHLFNANPNEIKILLHPQSIVHAMIYYEDGSMVANFSYPDMKIPIAYALAYPNRIKLNHIANKQLDLDKICYLNKLHFDELDSKNYPCLQLAIDASNCSQSATIILNAANEIAVESFLNEVISFTEIAEVIHHVLNVTTVTEPNDIEDVLYIDQKARETAKHYVIYNK